MPRPPRVIVKDSLYYISCSADYNYKILQDNQDYRIFLELLKKYKAQYGFKLYAFVVMPNHFHLLLELPFETEQKPGISEIMRDLNSSYTKHYNSRYNRKGHLFRERFKLAWIEKEPYILEVATYIHLNPLRLNLVKNLEDYPYSSYLFYVEKDLSLEELLKEEKEVILSKLKDKSYSHYLEEKKGIDLHKVLQKRKVLGSEEFQKKIIQAQQEAKRQVLPEKKNYFLSISWIVLLFVLIGLGFLGFLKFKQRPKERIIKETPTQINLIKLEGTEWQIRVFSEEEKETLDVISFLDGKFNSRNLKEKGFLPSNYILTIEEDKRIIWETMQSGPEGSTASWRGEIEEGKLRGVLSIKDKETKNFSFLGVSYIRKK